MLGKRGGFVFWHYRKGYERCEDRVFVNNEIVLAEYNI